MLAVAEHAWSRRGRRSPLHRRARHALSAGGLDVFSAALFPGKAVDLEEQRVREMTRDDVEDGAPPYGRIDLDGGVAYLDVEVALEPVGELDRAAQRRECPPGTSSTSQAEPLGGEPALEVEREEPVVASGRRTRVGTSGQAASGHGSSNGRADWANGCSNAAATTSGGTSWKKYVSWSSSVRRQAVALGVLGDGAAWPVTVHHSPPVSPGQRHHRR